MNPLTSLSRPSNALVEEFLDGEDEVLGTLEDGGLCQEFAEAMLRQHMKGMELTLDLRARHGLVREMLKP